MIVTVTPNPSLDRSASLGGPIVRGQVHRLEQISTVAAGKGVNICRALHGAGLQCLAVVPAPQHDPLLAGMSESGLPCSAVPIAEPVRTNLTVTEPDGTTTKFNAPGASIDPDERSQLENAVLEAAQDAEWVVLTGSLPPGLPDDWYAHMVTRLRPSGAKIAVDTSDAPLRALAQALPQSAPDLVKPNSIELAQICGGDGPELEQAASRGDLGPVTDLARTLVAKGIAMAMVTLGGAGALLVTPEEAWYAVAGPIEVRSTVGSGDSSLAGLLIGLTTGAGLGESLRAAVAWGTAAAALPGSTIPLPTQAGHVPVRLTRC